MDEGLINRPGESEPRIIGGDKPGCELWAGINPAPTKRLGIHLMVGEGKPCPYNPFGLRPRGWFYARPNNHSDCGLGAVVYPRPKKLPDSNVGAVVYPRP